ncbi:NAD(+) synthase [Reichenbachiella agarivorans]|uniref:Glutamine-dependent NAD(+) synthetase n=1 Tax=Reichenbachiella agarivorans TaxID=2979464 RepID=A0ABY6CNF2_9BACT|nr:NAD(+) synthase [Reichenbachiella agarivorans]UXP31289.1 NAD(+) synthase [Reichenbachiella agarivorans]
MNQVRIGGACLNQTPIDWENNIRNIKQAIDAAKRNQVKILCLPELCITAYGCQDLFLSNWVPEEAINQLLSLQDYCQDITVAVGLPIQHQHNTYNCTCIISNQEIKGFYAKQSLANDGIHYEKRWFSSWPRNTVDNITIQDKNYPIGDLTFDIEGLLVGIEICEDAWRTDRPACRLYEKGVDLILNPSASHFSFEKKQLRDELVLTSSQNFHCHYLYVNQLGNESGRVIYDGDVLLAHEGRFLIKNRRLTFKPFELHFYDIHSRQEAKIIDDFRTSQEEFAQAGALALFDYMRKTYINGYVLSLSGGADSSSIAVLVAHMVRIGIKELGIDALAKAIHLDSSLLLNSDEDQAAKQITQQILFTAYQGTKNSSTQTLESAQNLAESLGAQFRAWTIDESVLNAHRIAEEAIGRKLSWETDDIALQNIQARTRSPLIWMIANLQNKILLTTSNRSEGDVGYTTMDGDTSGSLAPIAGVDKPFVLQWLKYAEKELGYTGLKYVNQLTPTAELRPQEYTQTDEDDLMPYTLMVAIERLAIAQRQNPVQVFLILNKTSSIPQETLKSYIIKFYRLWSINQWKRERLAPSFHLDDFNVDPKTWCRFPIITSGFKKEIEDLRNL